MAAETKAAPVANGAGASNGVLASGSERPVFLSQLNKLTAIPDAALETYLHTVVDELCGRDPMLNSAAAKLTGGVSALQQSAISTVYQQLFTYVIGQKLTKEQFAAELKSLSPKAQAAVTTVANARRSEIEERLKNLSAHMSPAYLHDFDWALRLVMSSDSISAMRNPILMLNLTLKNVDGSTRNVAVELTKADVDSLIANGEHINAVVAKLKL